MVHGTVARLFLLPAQLAQRDVHLTRRLDQVAVHGDGSRRACDACEGEIGHGLSAQRHHPA